MATNSDTPMVNEKGKGSKRGREPYFPVDVEEEVNEFLSGSYVVMDKGKVEILLSKIPEDGSFQTDVCQVKLILSLCLDCQANALF